MTSETLTSLGPRIVGLVFLAAALMKTAAPASFLRHINRLRLAPELAVRIGAPVLIALEAGAQPLFGRYWWNPIQPLEHGSARAKASMR